MLAITPDGNKAILIDHDNDSAVFSPNQDSILIYGVRATATDLRELADFMDGTLTSKSPTAGLFDGLPEGRYLRVDNAGSDTHEDRNGEMFLRFNDGAGCTYADAEAVVIGTSGTRYLRITTTGDASTLHIAVVAPRRRGEDTFTRTIIVGKTALVTSGSPA